MLKVNEIDVYYGDLQALREVSIEVPPGEVVSVIGSNGAGKSTLLKTISGMLRPRKGAISLNGNDISHAPSSRIVEQGISHVPEGRQIFPTMTVLENLEMGAQFPANQTSAARNHGAGVRLFPPLKGTPRPESRDPERRRAADAGHGPRPDVAARTHDAG